MKDIKEDMNKWEKTLCSWIGKPSSIFFLPNAPKQIYKFSAVPANIPTGFLKYSLSS